MPVVTDVSDVQIYEVWRGEPLTLGITVGEGNIGGAAVTYQGCVRPYEDPPMELEGAETVELCFTRTEVRDINPVHDRTSVTYELSGGSENRRFRYEAVAPADGIVTYRINFVFTPRDRG